MSLCPHRSAVHLCAPCQEVRAESAEERLAIVEAERNDLLRVSYEAIGIKWTPRRCGHEPFGSDFCADCRTDRVSGRITSLEAENARLKEQLAEFVQTAKEAGPISLAAINMAVDEPQSLQAENARLNAEVAALKAQLNEMDIDRGIACVAAHLQKERAEKAEAAALDRLAIEYWRDDGHPLPADAFGRQYIATRSALEQAVEALEGAELSLIDASRHAMGERRPVPCGSCLSGARECSAAISAGRKCLNE